MADNQWQTQTLVLGQRGVDLFRTPDQVHPLAALQLRNLRRTRSGAWTPRPGMLYLAEVAGELIHSIRRLNVPTAQSTVLNQRIAVMDEMGFAPRVPVSVLTRGAWLEGDFSGPGTLGTSYDSTRIWGAGTKLYRGLSGVLSLVESGFSGDPLTLLPYRPPLSSVAWMHVADRLKMRRVRPDGLCLPLGLPEPKAKPTVQILTGTGGLAYMLLPTPGSSISGSVTFQWTVPVGASKFFLGIGTTEAGAVSGPPDPTNLHYQEYTAPTAGATVAGLPATALYVALWTFYPVTGWNAEPIVFKYNGAAGVQPVPVIGAKTIDPFDVPGDWTGGAGTGGAPVIAASAAAPDSSGTTAVAITCDPGAAVGAYYNLMGRAHAVPLNLSGPERDPLHIWIRPDIVSRLAAVDLWFVTSNDFSATTLPGSSSTANTAAFRFELLAERFNPGQSAWNEFGTASLPLHRDDATKYGAPDWKHVYGVVIQVSVDTNAALAVAFDDAYFGSGSELDSSAVGAVGYDWRITNYDPRTGDQSNPSKAPDDNARVQVVQQPALITPIAYGDAEIRQRFYRRGGSIVEGWYFVGQNEADGAPFLDTASDLTAVAGGLLELDNYQPVATVDAAGEAVYAQPLPVLFGPVQDLIFGLGDPYRPGDLYWCKPGNTGSWPLQSRREVCSTGEELMNGGVYGGQAFCLSTERGYLIYPNLTAGGSVTVTPSGCTHGLAGRYGMAVGLEGIFFVAKDGIYQTAGGPEASLTEDSIRPIFHGDTKEGYAPVDWSHPNDLRLHVHDNELWFGYRDVLGARVWWVYNLIFHFWRPYEFPAYPVSCVYSEEAVGELRLLLGGALGVGYTHEGASDGGQPIAWKYESPDLDQQNPRSEKLYGDIVIDADRRGVPLLIEAKVNNATVVLPSVSIASDKVSDDATHPANVATVLDGRRRYTVDIFGKRGDDPIRARNLRIAISGESATEQPEVFLLGVSYDVQPETTVGRVTTWDSLGSSVDKRVKGVLLECDTYGATKLVEVQADGVTLTTLSVSTTGRRVLHFTFPQVEGRLFRLKPQGPETWTLYHFTWIFDEEPLSLSRWESQEVNHGIVGWQSPLWAFITIRSTAPVVLTLQGYSQTGTSTTHSYTLPSTEGRKGQFYVPFRAVKAVMWKWLFEGASTFFLYREESVVAIQPWGAQEYALVKPFGSDDLDLIRRVYNAEALAGRPGLPYYPSFAQTLSDNNAPEV